MVTAMENCQAALHHWGAANQVTFDPEKESFHILDLHTPWGSLFKLLGIVFDPKLIMDKACRNVGREARWRLKTLLRTRRFHSIGQILWLYKSHILSYIESSTPAVYHAAACHLQKIDHVQDVLLREMNLTSEDALMRFNLAPLKVRRDIAMLGLIHRCILGKGPPHFRQWFVLAPPPVHVPRTRLAMRRHCKQLVDPCDGSQSSLLTRSPFGLIRIYNLLPQFVVSASTAKLFQSKLQSLVKRELLQGSETWHLCLCPSFGGRFPSL